MPTARIPLVLVALVTLLALPLQSCLSARALLRGESVRRVVDDASYVAGSDNDKHRLDVYAPEDAKGAPVAVFIHGGYWESGDRDTYEPVVGLYGNIGQSFSGLGIVTFVPSYRLWPEVGLEAMLDDVVAAIRYAVDHAAEHGGDPTSIFLTGHSAGGHLVTLLLADPDRLRQRGVDPSVVRGVVALSPPLDIQATYDRVSPARRDGVITGVFPSPEVRRAASPVAALKAHGGKAPLLVLAGDDDYLGILRDFRHARHELAYRDVTFTLLPKLTHEGMVLSVGGGDDLVTPEVARFVAAAMARPRAQPNQAPTKAPTPAPSPPTG